MNGIGHLADRNVENGRLWDLDNFSWLAAAALISKKRVQSHPADLKAEPKKPRVQPAMRSSTGKKDQAAEAERAATDTGSKDDLMDQDIATLRRRVVSSII